jgi:F-type H+-transporting ATPase subunit delta
LYLITIQTIFNSQEVVQVNIPAESGDMGILSSHVPSIEPLRPGVVEIIESNGTQKFFGMSRVSFSWVGLG